MFRQFKTNEVALLLHGLRAIYVEDQKEAHKKLTKMLETELASRNVTLKAAGERDHVEAEGPTDATRDPDF